jgi:hypothetical protein
LDFIFLSVSSHDHAVILGHDDLLGGSKTCLVRGVEGKTNFIINKGSASGDGDVLKSVLSVVSEARSLDGNDSDSSSELVEHKSGESLALNVLSNNHNRSLGLGSMLKVGKDLLNCLDLGSTKKDDGVLKDYFLFLIVIDEVRRDVSSVELKSLNVLNLCLQSLSILNCH